MAAAEPSQSVESTPAIGKREVPGRRSAAQERWLLTSLLLLTLVIRGAALWTLRDNLKDDPDAYREIAEFLLQRGEFAIGKLSPLEGASRPVATAYRPPLYPVVLSNLPAANGEQISMGKIAALHLLLGVATVWLTWVTMRRMLSIHVGHLAAAGPFIAGLFVACDPILVNQQTIVMTETLATFLAILSLGCLARFDRSRTPFNAAMAGGAIGLAVLCRPTFLPWLALVAVAMLLVQAQTIGKKSPRGWISIAASRLSNLGGLLLGAAAIVSPWVVRNYREWGKPLVTTTHGGYTFYLGNNDLFYRWLMDPEARLPWDATAFNYQLWAQFRIPGTSIENREFKFDENCYRRARETIQQHPDIFAAACGYRLRQLWSPLPHQLSANESSTRRALRFATCAWYCSVYALAFVGVWRLQWSLFRPPWIWGVLLCLAFTAVHTFYWTNLRMRAPLMPFVAIIAAAAIGTNEWWRDKKTEKQ
jgi:hypothetical protein